MCKMNSWYIRQNLSLQDCRKHWRKTLQIGTFWQNDFQLESRPRAPVANSKWDSKRLICFSFLNLEELLNWGNCGLNFQFSSNRARMTLNEFWISFKEEVSDFMKDFRTIELLHQKRKLQKIEMTSKSPLRHSFPPGLPTSAVSIIHKFCSWWLRRRQSLLQEFLYGGTNNMTCYLLARHVQYQRCIQ